MASPRIRVIVLLKNARKPAIIATAKLRSDMGLTRAARLRGINGLIEKKNDCVIFDQAKQ